MKQISNTYFLLVALCLLLMSSACQQTDRKVLISTNLGDMQVKLYDETPKHRDNFIKLTEEGYYDGTLLHSVFKNFIIMGGDPDSKTASPDAKLGLGGPGYTLSPEFVSTIYPKKGVLVAARENDVKNPKRESSGSQFYIVHGRKYTSQDLDQLINKLGLICSDEEKAAYQTIGGAPHLDGNYTIFGEVVSGLDIIDKINNVALNSTTRPKEDVKVSIKIIK